MKIKNLSNAPFNLKSGVLKPGAEGVATFEECKVLFSSNKAEMAKDKPAVKKAIRPKAKSNG